MVRLVLGVAIVLFSAGACGFSIVPTPTLRPTLAPAPHPSPTVTALCDALVRELYDNCTIADRRSGKEPNFVDKGTVKYFQTSFCSINHMCDSSPGPCP